jgi:biotin transporter BioY
MPASAYGLVAVFIVISLASGLLAAWLVGPRRWWAAILPTVAGFVILYLLGHRWVVQVGPQVPVLGWEISLPFEIVAALAVALAAAAMQRGAGRLLQADQRRAGRDGLA